MGKLLNCMQYFFGNALLSGFVFNAQVETQKNM